MIPEKWQDSEAKNYFDSLPAQVQEQIMQSGVEITTKAALEQVYSNLLSGAEMPGTPFVK